MLADAHTRAECQRYLTSFRVQELKELLRNMGCSQKGRKHELFQRANEVLQHGSPKIQNKIREIYEKTNSSKRALHYNRMAHRLASPTKAAVSPHRSYIVHPDVKFKPHPFFLKMDTVIRPTSLVSAAMSSSGTLSMRLQFHLTPQQVHEIYMSKTQQGTYQTQVLLRFCRQETSCEQEDFYPKQCYLKVNGQYCSLPNYYPHLSTRPDYKRNGSPVNLTNYIKTSATQTNDVVIYWGHDILYPQGFCVCIDMVQSQSTSDILQSLKAKGFRSPDVSRALVKEKLKVDRDSEISATSLRVSLLCPVGKMRMQHPCRAICCKHLQCFDASIYLQMNEKKARWVCPVCDKPAPVVDLFIDGLFMEICEQSSSNDIEFRSDGSWHPITNGKDASVNVCTPERKAGSTPVMIGDTPTPESKGGGSEPVVIDLTLSSDEEESDGEESEGEGEREEEGDSTRWYLSSSPQSNSSSSTSSSTTSASSPTSSEDIVPPIPAQRRSSSSQRPLQEQHPDTQRGSLYSAPPSPPSSSFSFREPAVLQVSRPVSVITSQGRAPHSHSHMYTHSRSHTHAPLHTHSRSHTHAPLHTHSRSHTHAHAHSPLHTHARSHSPFHSHIHPRTHSRTQTRTRPAPYHLYHNDLHSDVPSMVDDALFPTLHDSVFNLFNSAGQPELPSPGTPGSGIISLD